MEYYYNVLGRLTNITERSGADASSGYLAAADPPGRNRLLAALGRVPQGTQGAGFGCLLLLGAVAVLPRRLRFEVSKVMRLCLGSFSASSACSAVAHPAPRIFRLRLATLGWRFATYTTVIALLFTDPRLDFWCLHAECVYPHIPKPGHTFAQSLKLPRLREMAIMVWQALQSGVLEDLMKRFQNAAPD